MNDTRHGLFEDEKKPIRRTRGPIEEPVESTPKKKPRITVSSAKAKGRRLQQWVAKKISDVTGIECGKDCLIESREMGQDGVDVKLYGIAKEKFPFSVECKNQESWSIIQYIKQAKTNNLKGTDWILFLKKNLHEEIVVMDAKAFFDIYEQHLLMLFGDKHKLDKK